MTILVAIRDLVKGVHIGGDTAVVWEGRREEFGPKWITVGRWHIGTAGYMRAVSALLLARDELAKATDLQALAVLMRAALRADGWIPNKDDEGYSPSYKCSFLVTDGDVIGEISGSFVVSTCKDMALIGSGAELARGFIDCATFNGHGWLPLEMLKGAIACAMRHREDCAGEVWTEYVHGTRAVDKVPRTERERLDPMMHRPGDERSWKL